MKQRRRILGCVLLLSAAALLSGCDREAEKGPLKVGVRSDIMNFGYLNETTGKYYGLEIEIAQEMAKRMGYAAEFVTVEPDTRKDMLLNGDVDCLVATYSIAESRMENFDFSAPYYHDETVIMVENSTLFDDISDLQGKTFGIASGANAGPLLANKLFELEMITDKVVENTDTYTLYEGADVIKAATYEELSWLLEEGTVDAACLDACIAETYMNEDRSFLKINVADQEYGVATVKDSELSEPVAAAIQEMLDDGTIDSFIEKWHGEEEAADE